MRVKQLYTVVKCGCGNVLEIEVSSTEEMACHYPKPIPCACGNRISIHLQESRKPIDKRLVEILKGNIQMHQRRSKDPGYGTEADRQSENKAMEECQRQLSAVLEGKPISSS